MTVEVITKSRLESFNRCQRYHRISYVDGYRSLAPREEADFGTVVHAGLDAWYLAYQQDSALSALADAVNAVKKAATSTAMTDFQIAKAELLLHAYDARWAAEMASWEVLGVEVEFIAVLPNRKNLRIAGKLDRILRRRADRAVFFMENKTSGADLSPGSSYWQRLRMDPQVSIYYDGMTALGHDAAGCIYDVLVRPSQKPLLATPEELRKYTKATAKEPSRLYANQRDRDEIVEEYRDRMGAVIAADPGAYFARVEVPRTDAEMADSRSDVDETAVQIRTVSRTGVAPRNPSACMYWGRTCDFLEVCSGLASLDDTTKFRRTENAHEELSEALK